MVSSDTKLAIVVGGKAARACDNCLRKCARWYCAADDAFLCQSCDGLVHAANPLARRHERLRLKIASLQLSSLDKSAPASPPWHQGFTKKPRTPRGGSHHKHVSRHTSKSKENDMSLNPLHLVPEIGSDTSETTTTLTCEEQLLYQVPVFDLFAAELCLSGNSNEAVTEVKQLEMTLPVDADDHQGPKLAFDLNSLNGLMLPSDVELAEFAADVENLLGKGLDDEAFAIEGLGLLDCREKDSGKSLERVKVEEEDDQMQFEMVESEMEMMREPFQLSFDYDSPIWEEKDEKVAAEGGGYGGGGDYMGVVKEDEDEDVDINIGKYDGENKKIILKLDFEGIIAAWDEQRSPWTTGGRPELEPDDCWPECMGLVNTMLQHVQLARQTLAIYSWRNAKDVTMSPAVRQYHKNGGCGIMHHHHHPCEATGMMTGNPTMLDGGREARVSRYREKRRTRLFSKKIRYEVRKLNAEKRPRMKGRFVKRASSLEFPSLSKK